MSGSGCDLNRVRKELVELGKVDGSGVTASPVSDADLTHLTGTLTGPKDSPYEGGTWHVDISLPRNYPFEPPKMKFTTPLWHPNVSSQTGAVRAAGGGRRARARRARRLKLRCCACGWCSLTSPPPPPLRARFASTFSSRLGRPR